MQFKIATVIGATGMIGNHLLQLLLKDTSIKTVRIIVRREVPSIAPNLEVRVIDFNNPEALKAAIMGSEVVFCTIGTTQKAVGGNKSLYRKIDFDIPVTAAKFCKETGCENFVLVSSIGADTKSNTFYLKLKGEVEEAVKNTGIKRIQIMQPSMLLGHRTEKRAGEKIFQKIMVSITSLFLGKFKKYKAIEAFVVAKAMLTAAKNELPGTFIYQYQDIVELANKMM